MDPTIIAAIIGAIAVVVAAIIGTLKRKAKQKEPVSIQSPTIGTVAGNVYITYSEVAKQPKDTEIFDEQVIFVTEDVRLDKTEDMSVSGLPKSESRGLHVRFTIHNNSPRKIKIYNFHTVEYQWVQTIFYAGGSRVFLEISPDKPFIEQDKTFEVEPKDSVSFRLCYNMKVGGGAIQVVLGVIAYYHTPSGELGKAKSDKLYLVNPARGKIMVFDSKTASFILDVDNPSTFSYGWVENAAQWQLENLLEALNRHRAL